MMVNKQLEMIFHVPRLSGPATHPTTWLVEFGGKGDVELETFVIAAATETGDTAEAGDILLR
jgi:hypothetical protein